MPRTNQSPAFRFYPGDFANDGKVEAMTTAAVGAYILLLCKAWHEDPPCSIPADPRVLSRWTRMTSRGWSQVQKSVLAAFKKGDDGRYYQMRLKAELDKQLQRKKALSDAGRYGANKRWGGHKGSHSHPNRDPNATPMASDGLSYSYSVSSSDSNVRTDSSAPQTLNPKSKALLFEYPLGSGQLHRADEPWQSSDQELRIHFQDDGPFLQESRPGIGWENIRRVKSTPHGEVQTRQENVEPDRTPSV